MADCLIALGANLGDRGGTLDWAVGRLGEEPGVEVVRRSRWIGTAPVGGPPGQGEFLNGAVLVQTSLSAQAVAEVLHRLERERGRERTERWGPRPLDLDLLLYDDLVLETEDLTVPHPRMAWRRFVLEPAAEVAPAMLHPTTGWTVRRLLEHLDTAADYVAFAGPIGVGKTLLAGELAAAAPAKLVAERFDTATLEAFYADPGGRAWAVELEFLDQRARLLAADSPEWSRTAGLRTSDFWFHQSLAFAKLWLPPEQFAELRRRWEELRPGVVAPKLTVLLDAPTEVLLERIARRGRPGELKLEGPWLDALREAIRREASAADVGPVMKLANDDPQRALGEVLAAVESM